VGVGIALVVIGLAVTWWVGRDRRSAALLATGSIVLGVVAAVTPSPCDAESAYYCIAIVEDEGDADGRYLVLDGLTHAYVDRADPTRLVFGYVRRFADASAEAIDDAGDGFSALHIGGGGFSFPRYLDAVYPDSRQTILELDPRIVEIARAELAFTPSEGMGIVVGDARRSIELLPDAGFDLVFADAFGGLAVPWHLTTDEFLAEIDRVMLPGATLAMNLIDGPSLDFVRAEAATLARRFDHVAVISGQPTLDGDTGGNVVLVASDTPIDAAAILERVAEWSESRTTGIIHGEAAIEAFIGDAPVLTDDYAPVDQLLGR
jgi:SAM-dependent methyltransferase